MKICIQVITFHSSGVSYHFHHVFAHMCFMCYYVWCYKSKREKEDSEERDTPETIIFY